MNLSFLSIAFDMLNKANKAVVLNKWGCDDIESLAEAIRAKRIFGKQVQDLEKDIIEQFGSMNKNHAYIISKISNKTGNEHFKLLKQKRVADRISFFTNSGLEELNWFETNCNVDKNARKFIFYKLKEKKWVEEDGTEHKEKKLLIFQYELQCFGNIIWAVIKAPYIRLDNNKTYKFEVERQNISIWTRENLSEVMTVLPLKEFYESFKDDPPLENTGWSARSYRDEDNNITEGDFGVRLDYQGGVELNRVYQSINANLEPDFAKNLEFRYNNYCREKKVDINADTINFFRESGLLNSEIVFKGIQKRCEYLVGTVGYFENSSAGEKREKARFYLEKIKDETSSLLRITKQGDEHFGRIFSKIKKHFDPNAIER